MRVVQINNFHFPRGGSDRYFLSVARGLAENGHQVRTLSPIDSRDTDTDLRAETNLLPLSTQRPRLADIARFFYNPKARDSARRVIKDFRPDIAHLHIYYGQLTSSILQPFHEAGIPVVQTLHEYKIVCPAQTMMRDRRLCTACQGRRYWNAVLNKCNRGSAPRSALTSAEQLISEWLGARRNVERFLAVSEFQRKQLIAMGLDEEKVSLLHNFTDVSPAASESRGDYFLFAGRITEGKGLETLIRAYDVYKKHCQDDAIPLYIVGEGDAEQRNRALAEHIGVADEIIWRGHTTGDELIELFRNCRALINPSEFNETFGLSNLEAMSHGRPVICTDRGAFPEIVRDGIDGFVIKPRDVDALAEKMSSITSKRAINMGQQAYERCARTFSKDTHLSRLETIYFDTLRNFACHE